MIKKKSPAKKTAAKKAKATTIKKTAAKKTSPKKSSPKKVTTKKAAKSSLKVKAKPTAKKPSPKKTATKKSTPKKTVARKATKSAKKTTKAPVKRTLKAKTKTTPKKSPVKKKNKSVSSFLEKQRIRLLELKDTLLDSMNGVARDNLHAGSDTSAFGMHQADAGSDAYDRDFALSILSQEQNSLHEIDAALKRINDGTYGICEISNKPILHARLEAQPFTRYTVECQAELEKRHHVTGSRIAVSSLFGISEDENESDDDENEKE